MTVEEKDKIRVLAEHMERYATRHANNAIECINKGNYEQAHRLITYAASAKDRSELLYDLISDD